MYTGSYNSTWHWTVECLSLCLANRWALLKATLSSRCNRSHIMHSAFWYKEQTSTGGRTGPCSLQVVRSSHGIELNASSPDRGPFTVVACFFSRSPYNRQLPLGSTSIGLSQWNHPRSNLVRLCDRPKVHFTFALVATTFHRSETAYMQYHDLKWDCFGHQQMMTVPQITTVQAVTPAK